MEMIFNAYMLFSLQVITIMVEITSVQLKTKFNI